MKICFKNHENNLKHGNSWDYDSKIIYEETTIIIDILTTRLKLSFMIKLFKLFYCFSNVCLNYRIRLIIFVIIASIKRSFSKLKPFKSYLHPQCCKIN